MSENIISVKRKIFESLVPIKIPNSFLYIFSISAVIILHFQNIARGKGNSNVDFAKNDIMVTFSRKVYTL